MVLQKLWHLVPQHFLYLAQTSMAFGELGREPCLDKYPEASPNNFRKNVQGRRTNYPQAQPKASFEAVLCDESVPINMEVTLQDTSGPAFRKK